MVEEPNHYAVHLGRLREVEDVFELLKGTPRAVGWPDGAQFHYSSEMPESLELEDYLCNSQSLLVLSERFCDFFRALETPRVEYLPVTLINHKNRPAVEPYAIVHQIHLVDCIDEAQSLFERDAMFPERFSSVDKLAVEEAKIDSSLHIFRMEKFSDVPWVRKDIADKIVSSGFTGVRFGEIEDLDDAEL